MEHRLILKLIGILVVAVIAIGKAITKMGDELSAIADAVDDPPSTTAGKKMQSKIKAEPDVEESLGQQADQGDEDAAAALSKLAEKAGLDENEYPSWVELEEALNDDGSDANSSVLTLAALRAKAKPIMRAGHADELKELLESFDADSLSTLEESQFAKFAKSLDALAKKLKVK